MMCLWCSKSVLKNAFDIRNKNKLVWSKMLFLYYLYVGKKVWIMNQYVHSILNGKKISKFEKKQMKLTINVKHLVKISADLRLLCNYSRGRLWGETYLFGLVFIWTIAIRFWQHSDTFAYWSISGFLKFVMWRNLYDI